MIFRCSHVGCPETAYKKVTVKVSGVTIEIGLAVCSKHLDVAQNIDTLISPDAWESIAKDFVANRKDPPDRSKAQVVLTDLPIIAAPDEVITALMKVDVTLKVFDNVDTVALKYQAAKKLSDTCQSSARVLRNYPGDEHKDLAKLFDELAKASDEAAIMIGIHTADSSDATTAAIMAMQGIIQRGDGLIKTVLEGRAASH